MPVFKVGDKGKHGGLHRTAVTWCYGVTAEGGNNDRHGPHFIRHQKDNDGDCPSNCGGCAYYFVRY